MEVLLLYREFAGYGVDIATNVRILHAIIYPTIVCVEAISYKSIETTKHGPTHLTFTVRVLKNRSWLQNLVGGNFYLSYIPENNSWIKSNIQTVINNASREAAEVVHSEDAIEKLENSTPCRNTDIPEIYTKLSETQGEDLLWGYKPSPFEKKRSTTIQVVGIIIYFAVATGGLVVPVLRVAASYSVPLMNTIIILWVLYFALMMIMTTEFNQMVALSHTSIISFTTRLTCLGKFPQCGNRTTRLGYRSAYPLYSFLYRTPNSTPTEYQRLRHFQGLLAKFFGYTDGSGAIQFPNNLLLRLPNVHDVEWAILQKHYQVEGEANIVPINEGQTDSAEISAQV